MKEEIDHLLLSTQIGLCGAVRPELRALTIDIDKKANLQVFTFYYDAEITEELFELANVACTEASCALDYLTDQHILQLEFPKKIPIKGRLAFLRYEPGAEAYIQKKKDFLEMDFPLARLCLLTQQALLGKVTPPMRRVLVDIDVKTKKLLLAFVYDSKISEQNFGLANAAIEEICSYYPEFSVEKRIERVDFPAKARIKDEGSTGRIPYERNEEFLVKKSI